MHLNFESERLSFRPVEEWDLGLMTALWTDPEVVRYMADAPLSLPDLADKMPIVTRRGAGGYIGIWIVSDRRTGDPLGEVCLLPMPVDKDDTDWDVVEQDRLPDGPIEVGYAFKKSAWGKGLATEACCRLIRFAFEQTPLTELVAVVEPEDAASVQVLGKSGMEGVGKIPSYAGVFPAYRITKKQWQDAHLPA